MSETKFTPGPWVLSESGSNVRPGSGSAKDTIAVICGHVWKNTSNGREAKANAHLIAAAPELYAVLETLVERIFIDDEEGLAHFSEPVIAARAALAKARGEA